MKDTYEGTFYCAEVIYSNRFPTQIEITSVDSDSVFRVPQNQVEETKQLLELGKSPDKVAKRFSLG